MFLKSIEVQGFKSFAYKMTFRFGEGITGIVGPNGSGKSNIADAVRWVLGEQSARQLRGAKMEDVIFAGTENRKALGFAYVSITLDNSDHYVSSEYDTITVSRRVYRSGESEYKINGRSCRLRDIQELFFDTGIGKEGYSIIGQGQIDKILSGKPEDRRELFDEAVGIVKYKKRKKITEKNLETERQNLSRVKDILFELERQLTPLEKQSEKAKIYLACRDKLKILDANMYLISFDRIRTEADEIDSKISIASAQMDELKQEYDDIKSTYTEMEALMSDYDKQINDMQEKLQNLAVEKQRLEGEDRLLNARKAAAESTISQSSQQLTQIKKKIGTGEEELLSLEKEYSELENREKEVQAKNKVLNEALQDILSRAASCRAIIDSLNSEIIESISGEADLKGHIERTDTIREQIQQRKAELAAQLLSVQSDADKEGILTDAFRTELGEIETSAKNLEAEENAARSQLTKLNTKLTHFRIKLSENEKSYHEQISKYNTLKSVADRYDGYAHGVRRVMELRKKNSGIIGVVADVISVDKKYETAIETALGGNVSNIVTVDEKAAKDMIAVLKKERAGRASFYPLSVIKAVNNEDAEEICSEDGVIGTADTLVKTKKDYKALVSHLLGRVYVTDHIDHALALARKYHHSLRIVTLEGELLTPGGAISGGAYKNAGNLLGRKREIEELKEATQKLEQETAQQRKEISKLEKTISSQEESIQSIESEKSRLSMRKNTASIRMKQVEESKTNHDKILHDIRLELDDLSRRSTENDQRIESLSRSIEDSASDRKAAQDKQAEQNELLQSLETEEASYTEKIHEGNLQLSSITQQIAFLKEKELSARERIAELEHEYEIGLQGREGADENLTHVNNEIKANAASMQSICNQIASHTSTLEEIRLKRDAYTAEHRSFFDKREEISDQISSLDKELFRLDSQKEKNQDARTQLSSYMWEEYQLTWNQCQPLRTEEYASCPLNRLRKMISDVKSEIRDLGSVNVNAIEDYREVSTRYQEMKEQYDDLVSAEEKLTDIINGLNRSMEKQFKENFARISVEFDRVFKQLFGGGKGTLSLTDPENLLETGILITAQPPGKKLQNMMQLSGGEKALTAIAILFAIQNLKPSPFCLLDEIEAALDDSNVKRFAEYLHNLTKHTQFIVITHRRGTMKAADVLYGITMQEKGISTLVSVDFVQAELT